MAKQAKQTRSVDDGDSPDWAGDEIELLVSSGGALRLAAFDEPAGSRADFYEDAHFILSKSREVDFAVSTCPPLRWFLESCCEDVRDAIEEQLQEALREGAGGEAVVRRLQERLDEMPEDADGLVRWLRGLDDEDFERDIAPAVRQWLAEPPDWAQEDDYLPRSANAQGAAMEWCEDNLTHEARAALGIRIVEGEFPGSSYCAAELRKDVDEANAISRRLQLGVRFERDGG